jgi:hypothetical protein
VERAETHETGDSGFQHCTRWGGDDRGLHRDQQPENRSALEEQQQQRARQVEQLEATAK